MKIRTHTLCVVSAILLFAMLPCVSLAQQVLSDRQLLESPYSTIRTHLFYLQHDSYDPAISARTIPPSVDSADAEQLAIQIKQILDGKGLFVRMNMIPQDPEYKDSTAKASIYTLFPKEEPAIYLEKTDSLWYYSEETIKAVPDLHRSMYPLGADLISRRMPEVLRERIAGIMIWKFLGIGIMILAGWLLHLLLSLCLRPIVRWITNHVRELGYAEPKDIWKASGYISFILVVVLIGKILPVLQLPVRLSLFATKALHILAIILFMLLALVIVRILTKRFSAITANTDSKMDDQLLPIIHKLLQIGVVIAAIVYVLSSLDVNVAALIAGLSIGALALALAAQDTVKNLIGSIMIFIDKPFRVGDFVMIDGQEGTVTEVGFRSTRVQLLDTSILSIPNGNTANLTITNLGVRQFRLMNILIGVTYDTSPQKIEAFIADLRNLIDEHPGIHKENHFVHFKDMGDFALKIIFRCYIPVFTIEEELKVKEGIYLEIMRIAQRLEIEFAFPTQTIHVGKEASRTEGDLKDHDASGGKGG